MFRSKIIFKILLDSEGHPSPAATLWINVDNVTQELEIISEN